MSTALMCSALGLANVYFVDLYKQGYKLKHEDAMRLVRKACIRMEQHISMHRVYPERVDQFKFLSYLVFETLEDVHQGFYFKEVGNPVVQVSDISLKRLKNLLYIESNTTIDLNDAHCSYISNMLKQEISGMSDIGLGANGLATTFSMLAKYGNDRNYQTRACCDIFCSLNLRVFFHRYGIADILNRCIYQLCSQHESNATTYCKPL